MALDKVCSLDTIIVSGAGNSDCNGTYIKTGTEVILSGGGSETAITAAVYEKETDNTFKLIAQGQGGVGNFRWVVFKFFARYFTQTITREDFPSCPTDLSLIWTPDGTPGFAEAPAPTFTSSEPEPEPETENTFGLPAETVALITKNFGTVENYLRLRNQGQV